MFVGYTNNFLFHIVEDNNDNAPSELYVLKGNFIIFNFVFILILFGYIYLYMYVLIRILTFIKSLYE